MGKYAYSEPGESGGGSRRIGGCCGRAVRFGVAGRPSAPAAPYGQRAPPLRPVLPVGGKGRIVVDNFAEGSERREPVVGKWEGDDANNVV